jgi:deoxyribonuclease (pyrimidine dimer)
MTRVNCAIQPSELSNKHLIAELREIKRIPNHILKTKKLNLDIPLKFTLGTGHVKFFYNKLNFLYKRYKSLHEEALIRKFNVSDYSESFINAIAHRSDLANDYIELEDDRKILIQRLKERDYEFYKKLI